MGFTPKALQPGIHRTQANMTSIARAENSAFTGGSRTPRAVDDGRRPWSRGRALRLAFAKTAFAAFALFAAPTACTKGCEEFIEDTEDAYVVNEQYEVLMGVKDYLESKRGEFTSLTRGGGERILRRANKLSIFLLDGYEQIEIARGAVHKVRGTGVKFHTDLFILIGLNEQLNFAIGKLNPNRGAVAELHELASDIRGSRKGLGLYNWIVKQYGISPQAVINLSKTLKIVRASLVGLRKEIKDICSYDVDGYSTNSIVNSKLQDALGVCFPRHKLIDDFDHLKPGHKGREVKELQRSLSFYLSSEPNGRYGRKTKRAHVRAKIPLGPFCALQEEAAGDEDLPLTRDRALVVQRFLIKFGYLPLGSDDGRFGGKSNKAWDKAVDNRELNRAKYFCDLLKQMRIHMEEDGDDVRESRGSYSDIVYEFGMIYGYLPTTTKDKDRARRKCLVDAMVESESFKTLMVR